MIEINLNGLSHKQLKQKLESIKASGADIETKEHNVKRVEAILYGSIISDATVRAFEDFKAGMDDVDDII